MVPEASFESYYGRPILQEPTWSATDIAGYLFLGGLAGGSSVLAAGAAFAKLPGLARVARLGAAGAISLSLAALVHDLGRPARFINMLRVAKPTSPMSVGTWVLTGYAPMALAGAGIELTGWMPWAAPATTAGTALLGPVVAAYTAVLIGDTAVPAWHEPHCELPFVFVGSAASAAGGLGLLLAPTSESGPARRLALIGAVAETVATHRMHGAAGLADECYRKGRAGTLMKGAKALTLAGSALAVAGHRAPVLGRIGGAALVAASLCTRFGIFAAGVESTRDPRYVVQPQRARAQAEATAEGRSTSRDPA